VRPTHRILHTEELHRGDGSEKDSGRQVENNLTGQEEKEERKCVLASQPEHLSPPVTDSDSVVDP